MVDEVRTHHLPTTVAKCFRAGSCHLTTDGPIEELHAFAKSIGLRKGWFQATASTPHYDLTPARRVRAIEMGAVFVPAKEQARRRRAERGASNV